MPSERRAEERQTERARLLLAHEHDRAAGSRASAEAAGRVYDKLDAGLAPLLGSAGVRALFARSTTLTRGRYPFLDAASIESSTALRERLGPQDPAVALESAAALFGTFFALLTTFIGERLTTQVLRRTWPMIEEIAASSPRRDT